jgi:hypothetical protein
MSGSITAPEGQLSRRDKFRAYMQAFNPTAPAFDLIQAGLVIEDLHQSLYRNLAGRADLEPGSQQLLVGGIGSGKTTELLLAKRWLESQGHILPLYIDVSKATDLSGLNTGALVASLGLKLAAHIGNGLSDYWQDTQLRAELGKPFEKLWNFAYGKIERVWVPDDDNFPDDFGIDDSGDEEGHFSIHKIPGKLRPPLPSLDREIQDIREPLEQFLAAAKQRGKEVAVIFDGLDRLLDPTKFWSVAHQDLRLLRQLKVSSLATAPLSVLFAVEVGQSITGEFDRVQHLAVITAGRNDSCLRSVMEKRRCSELLNGPEVDTICHYSGGVLRDLISLARDAAEEAYVSEHDTITLADVEKVIRQLGNGYLRGLGPTAINALLELEQSKSFNVRLRPNVELLLTRRVLEYSSTDFRVHPALLSVIPRSEPKRA